GRRFARRLQPLEPRYRARPRALRQFAPGERAPRGPRPAGVPPRAEAPLAVNRERLDALRPPDDSGPPSGAPPPVRGRGARPWPSGGSLDRRGEPVPPLRRVDPPVVDLLPVDRPAGALEPARLGGLLLAALARAAAGRRPGQ